MLEVMTLYTALATIKRALDESHVVPWTLTWNFYVFWTM